MKSYFLLYYDSQQDEEVKVTFNLEQATKM
jgi:hypothetical protein